LAVWSLSRSELKVLFAQKVLEKSFELEKQMQNSFKISICAWIKYRLTAFTHQLFDETSIGVVRDGVYNSVSIVFIINQAV
jgi:hypothetical protein